MSRLLLRWRTEVKAIHSAADLRLMAAESYRIVHGAVETVRESVDAVAITVNDETVITEGRPRVRSGDTIVAVGQSVSAGKHLFPIVLVNLTTRRGYVRSFESWVTVAAAVVRATAAVLVLVAGWVCDRNDELGLLIRLACIPGFLALCFDATIWWQAGLWRSDGAAVARGYERGRK
jgi:hypothetical protein